MNREPLFILGNPRSGTSLLRSLLNAHPNICIPPECGFLLWLHPNWKDVNWNADTKQAFAAAVYASRKFETWEIEQAVLVKALNNRAVGSFAEAASCVYRTYAASRGRAGGIWGDKNNYYIGHVAHLKGIFPSARFVHMVRDVRDVACSYRELGLKTINSIYQPRLESNCAAIAKDWRSNNESAQHNLSGTDHIRIRYEDLVSRTESTINGIFTLLGIDRLIGTTSDLHMAYLDEPVEFLQWKAKLNGPVDVGSVGRFKQDLPPEEIQVIEDIAGSLLTEFGYLPNQNR